MTDASASAATTPQRRCGTTPSTLRGTLRPSTAVAGSGTAVALDPADLDDGLLLATASPAEQVDGAYDGNHCDRAHDHPDAAGRLADLVDLAADLSELGLDVRTSDLAIALDRRCHEPSSSLPLGRLLFHPAMDAPASTTA